MNLLKLKEKNKKLTLYGFSLGAYSAMHLATKTTIDKIILVSPSPLFKDIKNKIPEEHKKMLKKNQVDKTIREVCEEITCKVEIYVGEKELPIMIETAQKIAKELGVFLNIVPDMIHDEKLFKYVTDKS